MNRPVALFDLDYTLINADSEEAWSKFLFQRHLVDRSFVEGIEAFYQDYEQGKLDFYAYEQFFLGSLGSISSKDLLALRKDYLKEISAAIRPWMMAQVDWHRAQGHELLLITASNHFTTEIIAKKLQFRNIICTIAEKKRGKFTGKITGIPAFQSGKVSLLTDWLRENRFTLEGSWGYSDSHNDLPILNLVENPVAVSPDAVLKNHAVLHHWRILDK